MNWLTSTLRPKIRQMLGAKRDTPENLWIKCPESGEMVFHRDLEANHYVVPVSGYHMRMPLEARLEWLFGGTNYTTIEVSDVPLDPLKFRDERRYTDRLKDARAKNETIDAVTVATGKLDELDITAAIQSFDFMGGSLGMAAGEAVVTGLNTAAKRDTPFIMFAASGGARMQEGILSLMQMPRTTVAVQAFRETGNPYIVVHTNPTTGGVTASYAMLGDIHIAEPGALICFAGPRVIEQTIREQLPEGFQRAEYLQEHGMVDMVVSRLEMREKLKSMCAMLKHKPATQTLPVSEALPPPAQQAEPPAAPHETPAD
ncbi:acetyl-CoA carboxylase, carboxyltransferase subunit beta [Tepidamorphus sp. 3E244]|uniref:acetyl-CoA carboxylase, carboxyltransferase subunit beta n=1 Tax=Tepidamorphus sp. 3E244 TaxID=3385498 RepID=UPI0038FC7953